MIEGKFNIVFSGKTTPGKTQDEVKLALAQLFKSKVEQMERLFTGGQVTIKKGLEYSQAMKYQAALKQAGALALLQKVESAGDTTVNESSSKPVAAPVSEPPKATAAAQSSVPSAPGHSQEQSATNEVESSDQNSGNLSVAAAGEVIPGFTRQVTSEVPDTSAYELGKEGEFLQDIAKPKVLEVDTSELSLASAGEKIPNQDKSVAPVNPDISHLEIKNNEA